MRLAYLGPAGTFTEAALRSRPEALGADLVPCASIPEALDQVREGVVDAAMVPLESSVEGAVTVTLDELVVGDLQIAAETLVAVEFALVARPGTALGDVLEVRSHPHALAQCRRRLTALLPGARVEPVASTAEAASAAASEVGVAAVVAPGAAARYGLDVLVGGLADRPGAVTRFALVRQADAAVPAPTGADRTSLVVLIRDDHPGALLEVLTQFATSGVNLSRIESRPTGEGLGRYCFFVDVEGHRDEARVAEAVAAVTATAAQVRFLGSYPRADA